MLQLPAGATSSTGRGRGGKRAAGQVAFSAPSDVPVIISSKHLRRHCVTEVVAIDEVAPLVAPAADAETAAAKVALQVGSEVPEPGPPTEAAPKAAIKKRRGAGPASAAEAVSEAGATASEAAAPKAAASEKRRGAGEASAAEAAASEATAPKAASPEGGAPEGGP